MKAGRSLLSFGGGDSVGYTSYDFQTNAAMPDRIINWPAPLGPNAFLSSMITMAASMPAPDYADRGTHGAIALGQGSSREWLPITADVWRSIEPERAGFCDLEHLSDGRIIFVTHASDRMLITREGSPGTGDFTTTSIPGGEAGLWGRIAVGENDYVHVIWTYQNTDAQAHILKYSRSTDGGATWDVPVDLTGAGSVTAINLRGVTGGDAYAIHANGPNVVVWYQSQSVQIIQLRSRDNGTTWDGNDAILVAQPSYQRMYTVHDNPDSIYWPDPLISSDTAIGFRSDTTPAPGSSFDLMVDADGRVHGVYPVYPTYLVRYFLNGGDTTAQTFLSGIIYQADFNYEDVSFVYFDERDGTASRQVLPLPAGIANPNAFLDDRAYTSGFARWPNLGRDATGGIYLVYTSGAEGDVITATPAGGSEGTFYYGHTYVTWSPDGMKWSDPQNLSPNGVDAQYATLADMIDDELHISYQADKFPGDFLTSSGTNGSGLHPESNSNCEVLILPRNNLNTIGVDIGLAFHGVEVSVAPSPARARAQVFWTIPRTTPVSVVLFNSLGIEVRHVVTRVVMEPGQHWASIDIRDLPPGTYFARLSAGDGIVTAPFRIVR